LQPTPELVGASGSDAVHIPEVPAAPRSNDDQLRWRWLVWAFVGITWLGLVCAPLSSEQFCTVDLGEKTITVTPRSYVFGVLDDGAPLIGRHFGATGASAVFLAAVMDPGGHFCQHQPIHRWTALYGAVSVIGSASFLLRSWTAVACANHGVDMLAWENSLELLNSSLWVTGSGILCMVSVMRVQVVAKDRAVIAASLWRCGAALSVVVLVCIAIHRFRPFTFIFIVGSVVSICALLCFGIFQGVILYALRSAAYIAEEEARTVSGGADAALSAARWARTAAFIVAGAALTSALVICLYIVSKTSLQVLLPGIVSSAMFEIIFACDSVANILCALIVSGIIGGFREMDRDLATVGLMVHTRWKRQIMQEVRNAGLPAQGPAMVLSGICDGESPEVILANGINRFRCISWDVLYTMPDVITSGGPLDGGRAAQDLYQLTKPCRLACCDAFLSTLGTTTGSKSSRL